VSRDGKKIVVGEAKNELNGHAFVQVEKRKIEFELVERSLLPERLRM
jgi:hypothetical protein